MSDESFKDTSAKQNASVLNENLDGWSKAMGLVYREASAEKVVAELQIGSVHHQVYGIVHGGVYCGVIESLASVGGALYALQHECTVVGLDNQTSFIRAVRDGRLIGTALPVHRGRTTQLWEVTIRNEEDKLIATGRVRLMCVSTASAIVQLPNGSHEKR